MSLLANRYVLFISGECEVCLLSVRDVYEPCLGYYFCGKKIKHSLLKTNLLAISFFYRFFALLFENGFSGSCVNIPVKSVDETLAFSSVISSFNTCLSTSYLLPQNPMSRLLSFQRSAEKYSITPDMYFSLSSW